MLKREQTCWGRKRQKGHTHTHTYTELFSAVKTVIQCCLGISVVPLNFKESLLSGNSSFITFGYYMNTSASRLTMLFCFSFHLRFTSYIFLSFRYLVLATGTLACEMPSICFTISENCYSMSGFIFSMLLLSVTIHSFFCFPPSLFPYF